MLQQRSSDPTGHHCRYKANSRRSLGFSGKTCEPVVHDRRDALDAALTLAVALVEYKDAFAVCLGLTSPSCEELKSAVARFGDDCSPSCARTGSTLRASCIRP